MTINKFDDTVQKNIGNTGAIILSDTKRDGTAIEDLFNANKVLIGDK